MQKGTGFSLPFPAWWLQPVLLVEKREEQWHEEIISWAPLGLHQGLLFRRGDIISVKFQWNRTDNNVRGGAGGCQMRKALPSHSSPWVCLTPFRGSEVSIYSSSFLPEKSDGWVVKQLCRNESVEWGMAGGATEMIMDYFIKSAKGWQLKKHPECQRNTLNTQNLHSKGGSLLWLIYGDNFLAGLKIA